MKYAIILFGLIFSCVLANAEDIADLTLDPEHGRLNNEGEIEISFDLPDYGSIEEAYLEVTINGTATLIPGTELSDFSATGNTVTLKGEDLYELAGGTVAMRRMLAGTDGLTGDDDMLLADSAIAPDDEDIPTDTETADDLLTDADAEQPDDDAITTDEWPSERDGQYTVSLVVIVDQDSSTDGDADADTDADADADDDSDLPDADLIAFRAPIYGTGTESRESFTVTLDNVPPQEPADATAEGGNKKLVVTVTPPAKDANGKSGELVGAYHVLVSGRFLSEGAETVSSLEYLVTVSKSERDDDTHSFTIEGKDGLSLINNDNNSDAYAYTIRVWAEDLAGNADATRFVETTGSALTTEGFWSHYKSAGGKEDGGYCFIATAGYGSYSHPHVKVLRAWRDEFLAPSATGREIISFYYRNGPALAELVTTVPFARPAVQLLLFPIVVLAWLLLHPLLFLALLAAAYLPLRRLLDRRRIATLVLLFVFVLPLAAQGAEDEGEEKEKQEEDDSAKVHGDLILGGGFYDPANIDKSATGSPIGEVLSSDLNFMPTIYGGIDIPAGRYLKLTPHAGIGFVELKGRALRLDGTPGTESTYLYVLPLMAELKLRPVYEFPVRPYIAGGFDYYIWWILEDGHLAMDGGKFGFHGTVGLQISLNFIDPKTAIKLREATGILDTHLFAHYRVEWVNNFFGKKSFDLGSNRFEFGLMFDF